MARRVLVAVAVLAAAVPAAGCGRSGDREQARAVTERFFSAVQRHDGGAACAQLSTDTRSEVESQEKKPCAEAIGSLDLQPARVRSVQVFITSAKADLAGGESAFLSFGPEGWQLSAVGCRPQGGKPADEPYDCEAQA